MKKNKTNLVTKAVYTVVDQGVISAVNFLIGLSFIYFSTEEEYGLYTMIMGVFMLLTNLQNALINTPMIVLSPKMSCERANQFRKSMFYVLQLMIVPVIIALFFVNLILNNEGLKLGFFICIALSMFFLLYRDFFRAEEYSKLQPQKALRRDMLYSFLSLILIAFLIRLGYLNALSALLIIGFNSLLVSIAKIKEIITNSLPKSRVIDDFKNSWKYARWSLVGATGSWLQMNSYIYILPMVVGVRELAIIAASRLIMTPITMLLGSWGNFIKPQLAKKISDGNSTLKLIMLSIVALVLLLIGFLGIVYLILHEFSGYIPSSYTEVKSLIVIWFGILGFQIIRMNLSFLMQANLKFRYLAKWGTMVALLTIISTLIFIQYFGLAGALYGLLLGEIIFTSVLFIKILIFKIR
ncbi:Uncharacterised protein [Niallia circulans]|uniref:lipopolysaccharide biosynthesis protein n=1 Tax=Shouchella clausii TaxID=79880 RepID=UPI000BA784DA|nr:hypothetical protein [Shouchella clausii]PAD44029.1 hypothetical protein CHH54_04135 [Bacillus sp. 7520-S]PAE98481.1 hypothetical protein CHH71_03960 [Shouchella clausii]PAF13760.1 hypothetical protein CHH59_11985 [Shouchella clausii]SPT78314.1 Uncharacterised protein [Niallia circulans]